KDGKITESKYDNINADGKSKTEDTKYEESMKAKSGVGPEAIQYDLQRLFSRKKNVKLVTDTVTGIDKE
ncbi:hypothetical protein, partial [Vibrio cholerae]|uniref:hypothetical protein n=1 Tax=Vibrio cholerae TaxID=666 RepID=UPI003132A25D|nr:FMN-binding protein [Vibrio cholerae O1]